MVALIERFIKQAIVDKTAAVASASLVSALHLFANNKDVVKRWANEVQEATNSKGESFFSSTRRSNLPKKTIQRSWFSTTRWA